jgi:hypothetical protein
MELYGELYNNGTYYHWYSDWQLSANVGYMVSFSGTWGGPGSKHAAGINHRISMTGPDVSPNMGTTFANHAP